MKQFNLILPLSLFLFCFCTNEEINADNGQNTIEGIMADNYPRVDGSTSTEPLNTLIACKLLGWRYGWQQYMAGNGIWRLEANAEDVSEHFFGERIKSSQTHNSIINLIDNQTDIIISARQMSEDEKAYAENTGVTLIETPIALDALVFLLNKQNTVHSLTAGQIQDIYLGNITNWDEVGGANEEIKPFIRNPNSGSQEMMKEIVMDHAGMPNWEVGYTDDEVIPTMSAVYTELIMHRNGICFTPHYYREYIIRDAVGAGNIKSIAIGGISPEANSIKNKTYPFVANVYVSIRSDLDPNSMAFKMYEWLQTEAGQHVIAESGYVPIKTTGAGMKSIDHPDVRIYPNPVTENGFYITGLKHPVQMTLADIAGRVLFTRQVTNNEYIHAGSLQKGIYIAALPADKDQLQVKIIRK
jgi:phosphate transport system substrate-binding protein